MSASLIAKLAYLIKRMAQLGIAVGCLLATGLYAFQNSLIYPSSINDGRKHCDSPDKYGLAYESVDLKTDDGETLQCFSLLHDESDASYSNKTILVLSPNAGNIGHALPVVSLFYKEYNYNVFIYSYRGYGLSTGSPSETGLKTDAKAVMEYLQSHKQYSKSSLVLYGRSLGGAVAIHIASLYSNSVSAIILENTFLSIRKTIPHIFPPLAKLAMFVHQIWDSESIIPLIPSSIPVLLMSARKDEIVPPAHMDRIKELFAKSDTTFYEYDDSTHNDTVNQPLYWQRLYEFMRDKVNPIGY